MRVERTVETWNTLQSIYKKFSAYLIILVKMGYISNECPVYNVNSYKENGFPVIDLNTDKMKCKSVGLDICENCPAKSGF